MRKMNLNSWEKWRISWKKKNITEKSKNSKNINDMKNIKSIFSQIGAACNSFSFTSSTVKSNLKNHFNNFPVENF